MQEVFAIFLSEAPPKLGNHLVDPMVAHSTAVAIEAVDATPVVKRLERVVENQTNPLDWSHVFNDKDQ